MFARACPECGREILHSTKAMRARAIRRKQSCMSCSRKKPIDPNQTHKICTKCKELKEVSEFARHAKSSDGLQHRCRTCSNADGRANYQANKGRYFRIAVQRNEEMRARIRKLKAVPCADCRQVFDPVCMDFDHLPEFLKAMNISYMIRHRMSWAKIAAEIEKCEVVCANCHRLRTKARGLLDVDDLWPDATSNPVGYQEGNTA